MLLEITQMEQRYEAALGVLRDRPVRERMAEAFGVSRQAVHMWLGDGMAAQAKEVVRLDYQSRRMAVETATLTRSPQSRRGCRGRPSRR